MAHWKSMMDRDFMFAFDLQGREVTVTIDRVTAGELTGSGGRKSKKPLCYFREGRDKKPLALNATNCKAIAAMYGNDTDAWSGKRVTLYPTTTQMGGETVDCIRVKPGIPRAAKKTATEPSETVAPEPYDGPPGDEPEPREPGSDG